MKSKKSLTESILKKLSSNINEIDNSQFKAENNSFLMVPIYHPKINEIIKLLNSIQEQKKSIDKLNKEEKKLVITLNDILNSKDEKLITPKNSIITPMARDYIKKKKIEVIFDENKDE